jgi:predicted RNA-binding Zn-ribbon protein involved in translation (DUF1610 family)
MAFTSLELGGPAFPAGARGLLLLWRAATRYWEPTMPALPQKRLNLVPEPLAIGAVADAPPALEAIRPTVEYTCGNCDAVLMRADEDKILALIIHCTACGWYNSTGV